MKKWINPFDYIAGGRALAYGAIVLILSSILYWHCGITLRGLVSFGYGGIRLWRVTAQALVQWLLFSSLLYAAGRLLSSSKIRAVDVYGTNLFARIPLSAAGALGGLPWIRSEVMRILNTEPSALLSEGVPALLTLYGVLACALLIWFYLWSYRAYAVSCNLHGARGVVSFIVCYMAGEAIAAWPMAQLL